MDVKNFFTNLRTFLRACVYTGTTRKIFGDEVYIVAELPIENIPRFRSPMCFMMDAGGGMDGTHPEIIEQLFTLGIFVENIGSAFGEDAFLGTSANHGKGLFEIEKEVLKNLVNTTSLSGSKILLIEKSKASAEIVSGNNPLIFRTMTFSVLLETV